MIPRFELNRRLQEGLMEDYDPAAVGPISIDVRIDNWMKGESPVGGWAKAFPLMTEPEDEILYELHGVSPISIKPKAFIQARTQETFHIPDDLYGIFTLRSCVARKGLEQSSSLILRPGWSGKLVLELTNMLQRREILLWPGDVIGQVSFGRVG